MKWKFKNLINLFKNSNENLLNEGKWGIEKESLRIKKNGDLSLMPHPKDFGDKLENKYITTDFSESQLEFITPVSSSIEDAHNFLSMINKEALKILDNELIWPLSLPSNLPGEKDIPIAEYNNTKRGQENEIYREGLALRYGKKMQMISGVHYNFSFSNNFFNLLLENFNKLKYDIQQFRNNSYFKLARNFLRYKWILIYLFGASPIGENCYIEEIQRELIKVSDKYDLYLNASMFKDFATSLRMSSFGYSNRNQKNINISYDNLDTYILSLRRALNTNFKEYQKLGKVINGKPVQLNFNLLQKENELYSHIRVKPKLNLENSSVELLEKNGVDYIEIRLFDLNPFNMTGVNLDQLYFTHVFILFCLFEESKNISINEKYFIDLNDELIALFGRKENLKIFDLTGNKIFLETYAGKIFEKLFIIAELLDKNSERNKYFNSVKKQYEKIIHSERLPSSRIISEMEENNEDFIDFGLRYAKKTERRVKWNSQHQVTKILNYQPRY